jgi:polyisoprenoid-binding protein YceI
MKTKIVLIGMMVSAALIFTACSQGGQKQSETKNETKKVGISENFKVNASSSKLIWKGEMLGIYSHEGTLAITQANLEVKDGKIMGGSFTADMNSMTPTDENYNPEEGSTPEKLVGHLSSADFFDVQNYPTAQFEITSVTDGTVLGNLTIRGITHQEEVKNVNIAQNGNSTSITGELVFDRKKYDVAWDSPMKDRILSNDIIVKVELAGS